MGITIAGKSRIVVTLLVMTLFSSCMQMKYVFVSPGRVNRNELKEHVSYFNIVSDSVSGSNAGKYEVIAHGITSWRNYPMGVSKKGFVYGNNTTEALPINQLIDHSIALDPAISIELDAQYVGPNDSIRKLYPKDGAYIMHNIPVWQSKKMFSPKVLNYLHENTLRTAIDYFVKKEYFRSSKMYIEIKVTKDQFNSCDSQCFSLVGELETYIKNACRVDAQNWICITSFSPYALEKFRSSLPDELKSKVDYVLIVGYTGGVIKGKLAQSKGYVPKFDDSIASFVTNSEWLDNIWFSAQGVKDFKIRFYDMIEKRRKAHPEWKEISFSFSTYQKKATKMKKMMLKNPRVKLNIRSFMFDFDDERILERQS